MGAGEATGSHEQGSGRRAGSALRSTGCPPAAGAAAAAAAGVTDAGAAAAGWPRPAPGPSGDRGHSDVATIGTGVAAASSLSRGWRPNRRWRGVSSRSATTGIGDRVDCAHLRVAVSGRGAGSGGGGLVAKADAPPADAATAPGWILRGLVARRRRLHHRDLAGRGRRRGGKRSHHRRRQPQAALCVLEGVAEVQGALRSFPGVLGEAGFDQIADDRAAPPSGACRAAVGSGYG